MATATKTRRPARRAATIDAPRFDAYQAITDAIIERLEAGTAPWRMPWTTADGSLPKSLTTGKAYRGINPFLLLMSAAAKGYSSPLWGTYKAITEKGGQVRKGEKGTTIVFWKRFPTKELDEAGNPKQAMVLRVYTVFNVEQADGLVLPAPDVDAEPVDHDPIAECEAAIAPYLADLASVRRDGTRAFYVPATDALTVPPLNAHESPEEFYSTMFHEIAHSTGHTSRLDRPTFAGHTTAQAYGKEELVAELGAAMLAGILGVSPAVIDNSAAYLADWIKTLRGDNKLVVQAAAQAQRAADLVLGVTFEEAAVAA
ncbi:MAG: ArdC-like ssDNA-binding domain-containing protein [Chitinophagales bacterium]